MSQSLKFTKLSSKLVKAKQSIGSGKKLCFKIHNEKFYLSLSLINSHEQKNSDNWKNFDCDLGRFSITNITSFLQYICQIPIAIDDELFSNKVETISLYSALVSYHLSPEIHKMLGDINFSSFNYKADERDDNNESLILNWQIYNDSKVCSGKIKLSLTALSHLLTGANWKATANHIPNYFFAKHPFVIGKLKLSKKHYNQLSVGDVLIPNFSAFSISGDGDFQLGGIQLLLSWCGDDHNCKFEIKNIQKVAMNEDDLKKQYSSGYIPVGFQADDKFSNTNLEQNHSEQSNELNDDMSFSKSLELDESLSFQQANSSSNSDVVYEEQMNKNDSIFFDDDDDFIDSSNEEIFNQLQVELKLVAGHLTLTGEMLEQISVGNVLTIDDVSPGQAWLESGGKILAQGELVDIDGKLGFQIITIEE